ncbi:hypothetical protein, partial [Rhodoblastus sphagnicola]|uniref:hypothetical protein n=1 Tax=Rhodoblastus sphagnicola TaxID=333368 RepID=UPI001AEE31B9
RSREAPEVSKIMEYVDYKGQVLTDARRKHRRPTQRGRSRYRSVFAPPRHHVARTVAAVAGFPGVELLGAIGFPPL